MAEVSFVLRLIIVVGCALPIGGTRASDLLIDSFDSGPVTFSHTQSLMLYDRQIGSMLGDVRIVGISTERRKTTVTATIAQEASSLAFDTGDGPPLGSRKQGSVRLTYGGGVGGFPSNPLNLDLSKFDHFRFDITSLEGVGEISVVINSHVFGSDFMRVPLEDVGLFDYSFSFVNDWQRRGFRDVDSIDFWFIGLSPDFAVEVAEIRVVPEPGTSLSLLVTCLALAGGRRFRRKEARHSTKCYS